MNIYTGCWISCSGFRGLGTDFIVHVGSNAPPTFVDGLFWAGQSITSDRLVGMARVCVCCDRENTETLSGARHSGPRPQNTEIDMFHGLTRKGNQNRYLATSGLTELWFFLQDWLTVHKDLMQVPWSPLAVVQGVPGRASRGPWTTMCPSCVVALHVNIHWPSSAGCEKAKCLFILRFLLYLSRSARPTDSSGLLGNRESTTGMLYTWDILQQSSVCLPTCLPADSAGFQLVRLTLTTARIDSLVRGEKVRFSLLKVAQSSLLRSTSSSQGWSNDTTSSTVRHHSGVRLTSFGHERNCILGPSPHSAFLLIAAHNLLDVWLSTNCNIITLIYSHIAQGWKNPCSRTTHAYIHVTCVTHAEHNMSTGTMDITHRADFLTSSFSPENWWQDRMFLSKKTTLPIPHHLLLAHPAMMSLAPLSGS